MRWISLLLALLGFGWLPSTTAQQSTPSVMRLATELNNPRGVAVLPDGRLVVAEAGTGRLNDGRLSIFEDVNGDGDFDERQVLQDNLPSYNAYVHFNPGRDEVLGIGDVALLDDGRILYTLDDHFENIHLVAFDPSTDEAENIAVGLGTMNALAIDTRRGAIYVAESSLNTLSAMNFDGDRRVITDFPILAHEQQAVPAGVTFDPHTNEVLVALFSGQLFNYYGTLLSYMPGDAKIVRVNPISGVISDEITGLTTAVDVAIDEAGNIYVLEMTTRWASPPLFRPFDLYDPDSPSDDGGYPRFSGRVTLYSSDGSSPIKLADGLDTPTNITYYDGALYVSTGQGTPERAIVGTVGFTHIVGELYRITNY